MDLREELAAKFGPMMQDAGAENAYSLEAFADAAVECVERYLREIISHCDCIGRCEDCIGRMRVADELKAARGGK